VPADSDAAASTTPADKPAIARAARIIRANFTFGNKAICDRIGGGFSEEVDGLIDHPADNANAIPGNQARPPFPAQRAAQR
jgi:hypothetical protein